VSQYVGEECQACPCIEDKPQVKLKIFHLHDIETGI